MSLQVEEVYWTKTDGYFYDINYGPNDTDGKLTPGLFVRQQCSRADQCQFPMPGPEGQVFHVRRCEKSLRHSDLNCVSEGMTWVNV